MDQSAIDLRGLLRYVPRFRGKIFVIDLDWSALTEAAQAEVVMDLTALQSIGVDLVIVVRFGELDDLLDWAVDHEFRSEVLDESAERDRVQDVLGRGQAVFMTRSSGVLSTETIERAVGLGAEKLIVVTEFSPIERRGVELKFLRVCEISALKGELSGGEASLLASAAAACDGGIDRVHLLDGGRPGIILDELFSNEGVGTMVYAGVYRVIRMLREEDISELLALIGRSVRRTHLVPRSYEELAESLSDYAVMEVDGHVVGCVALYLYGEHGEIACLYVKKAHEGTGYGADLVRFMEGRARQCGLDRVFALTNRASEFFSKQLGYVDYPVEQLPESRLAYLLDSGRDSQAFVKYLKELE